MPENHKPCFNLTVENTAHDRYRRAGYGFAKGRNELDGVPEAAAKVIADDPFLKIIDCDQSEQQPIASDDQMSADGGHTPETTEPVGLDLSALDDEVASIVALINAEQQAGTLKLTRAKVPDTAVLEDAWETANGEKIQISATLRDQAWAQYQALTADDGSAADNQDGEA